MQIYSSQTTVVCLCISSLTFNFSKPGWAYLAAACEQEAEEGATTREGHGVEEKISQRQERDHRQKVHS